MTIQHKYNSNQLNFQKVTTTSISWVQSLCWFRCSSSVWIVQQGLKGVVENNVFVDGFRPVKSRREKERCKLVNIEKPPHPLVDLHVIGSTALWTEPIVASALHVDTKGRRPDKSGYMICSRTRDKIHKSRGMWIVSVRIAQLTLCCTTVCPRVPLQRSKGHKLCEFGPDQDWFWFLNRKKNILDI